MYRFLQSQISECHEKIREELRAGDSRVDLPDHPLPPASKPIKMEGLTRAASSVREHSYRVLGVDLTQVDGINGQVLQVFLSEVGPDLSRFRSASAFAIWLKLSPHREVSGKVLETRTERNGSRMAKAFRMAAGALLKSQSALGDCFRRFRTKLGAPKAITAMAHKIARIVYHLVTTGETFHPTILLQQQERQRAYQESRIRKAAARFGFKLVLAEAS